MSAETVASTLISPEEYIRGEWESDVRHEYIGGRVYAMAGASPNHNILTGNIFGELRQHLRGRPCIPFTSDMKVRLRIAEDDIFYYPDVVVACDPAERDLYFREKPLVIFEVMSPTTERIDREEKARAYGTIPGLEEYFLVSQTERAVWVYRRRNGWVAERLEGDSLVVQSLDFSVPLEVVYERTGL